MSCDCAGETEAAEPALPAQPGLGQEVNHQPEEQVSLDAEWNARRRQLDELFQEADDLLADSSRDEQPAQGLIRAFLSNARVTL